MAHTTSLYVLIGIKVMNSLEHNAAAMKTPFYFKVSLLCTLKLVLKKVKELLNCVYDEVSSVAH